MPTLLTRTRPPATALFAASLLALAASLAGCAGETIPRVRVGALPFPGPLTLYSTADPARLGPHYYDDWSSRARRPQEGSSGIVYTARAGFLDLSHLRESADWVRYISRHCVPLLMADADEPPGTASWIHQDTAFTLRVSPPEWFAALPREERARRAGALSADIAAAAAYLLMNWHEVATWHGWSTVPLVSERRSAFTWDDSMSHLVGIEIGRRVVRSGLVTGPEYDRAIAEALAAELRRLDAKSPAETDDAALAVKGLWWTPTSTGGEAVKRQTTLGLDASPVIPWTITPPAVPLVFLAPLGQTSDGHDIRACWTLHIAPPDWLLARAFAGQPPASTSNSTSPAGSFSAREEMPAVIERVAEQIRAEFGPKATTPARPDADSSTHKPAAQQPSSKPATKSS